MILAVFAVIIVVLVFAIAAGAIGRETHRLDAIAPTPTVEINDAVEWISERLPEEVGAQISYEDVRDLVQWHVEELVDRGVREQDADPNTAVVIDDETSVDGLVLRALSEGRDLDPAHIRAVVHASHEYFAAIGAVGPVADEDDAPDPQQP